MKLNLWEGVADPKKAILMAALRVFAQSGYAGATTREIAKEAGVANGLIFYHYKDKQTLFMELARHLRRVVAEGLQHHLTVTGLPLFHAANPAVPGPVRRGQPGDPRFIRFGPKMIMSWLMKFCNPP